jgi:pentatricopeptide repeat protein
MMREFEDSGVKLSRRSWHLILIAQLRNRDLDGARRSLKLMEQAGFPADPTTHTVIAANYRYLGLDAQVRDLALSTLGSLPPSNRVFVINQLLEAQAQFGDEHGFHQLLLSFDSSSIEPLRVLLNPLDDAENSIIPLPALASPNPVTPDAHTFLVTIRFCITRSNLLAAEKIFSLMTQRAFNLSPTIIAAFFALQFALDRPGFAVFLASRLLTPGEFDDLYDQLGRCTPEPDWRFPFPASYLRPTVEVLNALMQGLLRTRGLGAARVILELMKRVNVEPDPYTMRILVHHLIHSEQASPSHVLRMLRHLSPLFRPSLRHLHPIMGRLLRDEKFRLFSSENTVTPFPTSLTELDLTNPAAGLGLEQSLGRPNLGRSLLQSLESRGVQGDSVMLELRMRCEAIVKRDAITAIDVYNDMLARGMTPSVYHIAALMQAFTRRGETDKAVEIMRSAKMKPNLVMYTILLQGYAYQGKPKAAVHIFKTMVTDGIQPDARAIYALCRAFVLARQLASARKLLGTLWTFVEPFPWKYTMLPLAKLLILLRSLDRRASASKRTMSSSRRAQLRRDLAQVVVAYKRSKGLPNALASSSSSVRQLTKKAIHVNRKA